MNIKYRKTILAGNWKMNKTASETYDFAAALIPLLPQAGEGLDVVACVPFVNIPAAIQSFQGTQVAVGAQNLFYEPAGAFTGEISAAMLTDLGVKYVIIGHSERRGYFGETDAMIHRKVHAALAAKLCPIVCVGESLEQREAGITMELVPSQVKAALAGLSSGQVSSVVIAYEPIWAIGTGKTATAGQADAVCKQIRLAIASLYGAETARAVTIQYGGSMTPKNAYELLRQPDIDGGLIGGAALSAADFSAIVAVAHQIIAEQEN